MNPNVTFPSQQVDGIIQNIFSSFKSKLQELKWRDPKSLQLVMKKVKFDTNLSYGVIFLYIYNILIESGWTSLRWTL